MILCRRRLIGVSASAGVSCGWQGALATDWPSRPVKMVVGFPAGGPVDIAARTIAPWLSVASGQLFEVVNQPGDSGNMATRAVAQSPADGYTLLVCGPVNTINTTLFSDLDFSFSRDFDAVAALFRVPLVIEIVPTVRARSLPELLAYARAKPGALKVAYAGKGTPQHVGIELFKLMADIDLTLVPYAGSSPALTDLLAGKVDVMFDPLPSSIEHLRQGRLIPLAVTTPKRVDALPHVPAAADFVPGYLAGSWFGLAAPTGTPSHIVERLNREANRGLSDSVIQSKLDAMGAISMAGSAQTFTTFIVEETERYAAVIRTARINTVR